ncbi:hypothetical protein Bca4012_019123 [Brassica carinata]
MLAFLGCYYGGGDKERTELAAIRRSWTPTMAKEVSQFVNMYRITGDDWDIWRDVVAHFDISGPEGTLLTDTCGQVSGERGEVASSLFVNSPMAVTTTHWKRTTATASEKKTTLYYPKRGQTVELFCESLGFKGKGICKVHGTGFVVMCDRALPGERFLGRVTRRKGSYAEVTKIKTLTPHRDLVVAPCEYASYCGGCKAQNLSYEAHRYNCNRGVFY